MSRVGTGILIALGAVALSLCVLPWSRWAVLTTLAVIVVALWRTAALRCPGQPRAAVLHWVDSVSAVLVGLYLWYSTRPALWDWTNWQPSRRDFFFIWGARARLFLEHRGIDINYLRHAPNDLAHADYPWLWPLSIDWTAILFGWQPRLIGLLGAIFGIALLLVIRELFTEELGNVWAAVATLACVGVALPMTVGFAEAPYIAYSTSGILLLRRDGSRTAGILLGFAALTKNEGLALIVAVAISLVFLRRSLAPLWPAAAMSCGWLLVRAWLGIPTDLFAGNVLARLGEHLAHPASLASGFSGATMDQPWFFLALAIALLASIRGLRNERFVITVAAMQIAFFIGAYLISPLEAAGHVVSSWGRLQAQLAIPLVFAALAAAKGSGAAADRLR